MIYIVMGVSSSGKSLIAERLAQRLDIPFYDADEFHPLENIKKMERGEPLDDEDRKPWLLHMARRMPKWEEKGGGVLACSALKEAYRTILSPPSVTVRFIFLEGSKQLIAKRMQERTGHFMPESLLDSQFEALEEPREAITVSIDQEPDRIVDEIIKHL